MALIALISIGDPVHDTGPRRPSADANYATLLWHPKLMLRVLLRDAHHKHVWPPIVSTAMAVLSRPPTTGF